MEINTTLEIQINKEQVMKRLQADATPLLRQEVGDLYDGLLPEFLQHISPEFRMQVEETEKRAYVLFSLGSGISDIIREKMEQTDMLKALILDAMADDYLFSMDKRAVEISRELFAEKKLGVEKRLEPGVDLPIEAQKEIYDKVKKQQDEISVTKGYMFSPVKTYGYILQLTKDLDVFKMQHDCSKCSNKNCKMRSKVALEKDLEFLVVTAGAGREEETTAMLTPPYKIAVDLGTTTIAMQLMAGIEGRVIATYTCMNPNRLYGADVISRIEMANKGGIKVLQRQCLESMDQGMMSLCEGVGIRPSQVSHIGIAGNTVVSQIVAGLKLHGLATYPFLPEFQELLAGKGKEIFGENVSKDSILNSEEVQVYLMPPIAGFVGGDIVAGIYQCGFLNRKRPALFLDLGTNGEIVLGDENGLLATSVAAGPAFEGGGIQCGIGSVAGAVSGFVYPDTITTIQDQDMVGICGTGLIEVVSELLEHGILNKDGNLNGDYAQNGFCLGRTKAGEEVCLYQGDVRELQLAKAAIGTGIETLLKQAGYECRDVSQVLVAGGFGYRLNIRKAGNISLLPRPLLSKVKTVGNTSLAGIESFLRNPQEGIQAVNQILKISKEVVLANDEFFQKTYLKHINF